MLRRLTILIAVLTLVSACSSGSDSEDVAFEHAFDRSTETSLWTASGEAIDTNLLCQAATGVVVGFEDESGNSRTSPEIEALYEAGESFVNVSVELITRDDDSGEFTLRFINETHPSISDAVPVVASVWTIVGGSGNDTTEGASDSAPPQEDGASFISSGTGTITKE